MDTPMLIGMFLIVAGVFVAAYGLLPRNFVAHREAAVEITISAPEDAALGAPHWKLMAVLVIALVVDVMKPAALGFVVPGMAVEYGIRSEEHTSELQSLMRISYAVFCLKKKNKYQTRTQTQKY